MSAPFSIRSIATSAWPLADATCSGVFPLAEDTPFTLMSAPFSTRSFATSAWPLADAACSGMFPL
ncbi:hypothetical protein FB45DRAFT_923644 [Roridomyces roridus]|uniref:Uncharacterized protein n=1 Tax=Roridomyces roridus TaxID=1738132 RepID=A0AAD7BL75_9AGAR|nr:hypothetical protein FB45DRAFT_923644 [Roridomyces roridus]